MASGLEWRKTFVSIDPDVGVASEWVWAVQVVNGSTYLGYKVTMQTGLRWEHRKMVDRSTTAAGVSFIEFFAGPCQ